MGGAGYLLIDMDVETIGVWILAARRNLEFRMVAILLYAH